MNIKQKLYGILDDLLEIGDDAIMNIPSTSAMESLLLDVDSAIAFIDDAIDCCTVIEEGL